MAGNMVAKGLIFTLIFSLHGTCSSGASVGFSYDGKRGSAASMSPREAISLLQRSKIPSSHFRVSAEHPRAILDSLAGTNLPVDIYLNQFETNKLTESKALVTQWVKTHILDFLPNLNISSIIVSSSNEQQPRALLCTLNSIISALKAFDLDRRMKTGIMFSLPTIEVMYKTDRKNLQKILDFVKEARSFIVVEATVGAELSLNDAFVHSAIQRAVSACIVLSSTDISVVLNLKSSIAPSEVETAEFAWKMMKYVDSHPYIREKISWLFVEITPRRESEEKRSSWEEQIFPCSHRELGEIKTSISAHDIIPPVTNPANTPITIPSTNPTPGIITVPSTNPGTTPITVPATNPATTPVKVPPANTIPPTSVTNPTTSPVIIPPVAPVTNPVTGTPSVPLNPPATNPVTSYPISPPGSIPSMTPPSTLPGTVPVSPTVSGQSWCVAKTGLLDAALQVALDYACGIGGADCSAIQQTGSCYNPSSLQAHASYAFNSYYQKNPVPTSCDFGGTATMVSTNPSTGTCSYPLGSSASSINPPLNSGSISGTGVSPDSSFNSGPTLLNASSSGSSSTVFGSESPSGATSDSFTVSATWISLSLVVIAICITGRI